MVQGRLLHWGSVMLIGRLFSGSKENVRKPAYRDIRELPDRELSDIGLIRLDRRRPFDHAPVEVPNDRI